MWSFLFFSEITIVFFGGLESAYLLCPFLAKKSTPFPMCSSVDSFDCCFVTNLMTLRLSRWFFN